MLKIAGSVGRGGKNNSSDVKTVQELLRRVARFLPSPARQADRLCTVGYGHGIRFTPRWVPSPSPQVSVTGLIDDITIETIVSFQKSVLKSSNPDGRVDPGRTTFGKLVNPGVGPFFPFPDIPASNWTDAPRCFGARRNGGARAHAGSDLYFPVGTWIYAVADGEVVSGPKDFYKGTDQISIYHPSLSKTIRYGEFKKGSAGTLKKGKKVFAGTRLAKVGKMTGLNISMLHFEVYTGNVSPVRDTSSSAKKATIKIPPGSTDTTAVGTLVSTQRLSSLLDPTPLLDKWQLNRPTPYA